MRRLLDRFAPAATFVAIVMWEAACRLFEIPSFLLPAPSSILASFFDLSWSVWLGISGPPRGSR